MRNVRYWWMVSAGLGCTPAVAVPGSPIGTPPRRCGMDPSEPLGLAHPVTAKVLMEALPRLRQVEPAPHRYWTSRMESFANLSRIFAGKSCLKCIQMCHSVAQTVLFLRLKDWLHCAPRQNRRCRREPARNERHFRDKPFAFGLHTAVRPRPCVHIAISRTPPALPSPPIGENR